MRERKHCGHGNWNEKGTVVLKVKRMEGISIVLNVDKTIDKREGQLYGR